MLAARLKRSAALLREAERVIAGTLGLAVCSPRANAALGVVVLAPGFDDDLCLGEALEDLAVEQFIGQLRIEALTITVLHGTARLDERGPGGDGVVDSVGYDVV